MICFKSRFMNNQNPITLTTRRQSRVILSRVEPHQYIHVVSNNQFVIPVKNPESFFFKYLPFQNESPRRSLIKTDPSCISFVERSVFAIHPKYSSIAYGAQDVQSNHTFKFLFFTIQFFLRRSYRILGHSISKIAESLLGTSFRVFSAL